MWCGMHMCVVFTVYCMGLNICSIDTKFCGLLILWVLLSLMMVTNATVSVLMKCHAEWKGCVAVISSDTNVKRDEQASMANKSLVKQPHCSALGIHCAFPSLKS